MDIIESFGWMILGLLPTIFALEIAWKLGTAEKYKVKQMVEKKGVYNCIIASIGIEAAKQVLLEIPRKNSNNDIDDKSKEENHSQSYSVFYLSINNSCKNILRTGANAEEYYHVELKCNEDNGVEYGIQAYGEEAKELYKEIHELIVAAIATSPRYLH
jgi:hypothetical protein